ncbi:FtsQ-type POTRA domain-containing protein [Streptomyces sp. HNM0574]|uniref:cell division protein FtsQ/DivIB n=1 Tax=Streptomyces sp. HNM0574 TaxID=2714954 RepID=UPI00146ED88E|nr:FtsQ-type POTRA domain-containing protein [Streptomyces sp. HNM0574]NLU67627.1 FtsQ-type POTRA domain-containing protein [Streptomyces sp. HNM0574]
MRGRWRKPRRLTVILALVATVALTGFAVWALYGSDWLRVEKVSVSGTRVLSEQEVRHAAGIPLGDPVITVDRPAVERALLAELPRLATADVVRAWPTGIGLNVTERRPELVQEKAGKYVEVDRDGVRFATTTTRPKGVPLLVMNLQDSPNAAHFGPARMRREAVRVAQSLPASVARDTRAIRVRSFDSVRLELSGGRTVLWGSGERGAAKAKSLTALMKAAKGSDHFDVSVPSAPAASGS